MNANRHWRLIRALRARPPMLARTVEGLSPLNELLSEEATDRVARHRVFQAAVTQAEELWDAATAVGRASRPLPLFYSLSQAVGRSVPRGSGVQTPFGSPASFGNQRRMGLPRATPSAWRSTPRSKSVAGASPLLSWSPQPPSHPYSRVR
jgi:hypothetical protein